MNKCGKFCLKVLLHYIDIGISALGYFILPHPVNQFGNLGSGHHTFFSVAPTDSQSLNLA